MEKEIKHLKYFKVECFKGLESVELNDIAQFNIVLGDNNVGKTSVLEALLFDEHPFTLLRRFYSMMSFKGLSSNEAKDYYNSLEFFFSNEKDDKVITYTVSYNQLQKNEFQFSIVDTNGMTEENIDNLKNNTLVDLSQLPNTIVLIKLNGMTNFYTTDINLYRQKKSAEISYQPFIKSGLSYDNDLVQFFSSTVNNDLKLRKEFISNLHFLSDEIAEITIDSTTVPNNPILMVLFNNNKRPIPLFMMGNGTIRMVRLILEIMMCKDNRLMIDEIDDGLHFSKMKKAWGIVLEVAKKYNTQLFITTHNSECLKMFKEVLEDERFEKIQKDVMVYNLFKNSENKVLNVDYSFKEFENAIENNIEIRG
ncbi:AAA family ATPase [Fluviicola sp.]|jgi:AAA15 family ATPase/GTPase|uniref:AAA family ATPase n=1 Tax=Fluviicola sp. TaxID=1917219 RepID=UPI002820A66E|nr:AAA family ATPase [Fluviicola sp.]MDR0803223.1 AAA family ATPase [Fluviicola sp.]